MKIRALHIASILLLVFFFAALYEGLHFFGVKYNSGPTPDLSESVSPKVVRTVKRIRIVDETNGCTEITPDGVVRTFATCDGDPTDINRLANPKNILHLLLLMSEIDLNVYKQKPKGKFITMVIETDSGSQTIYVPAGQGGGDITHTIDMINGDLPQPTQTPVPGQLTPTPTSFPTPIDFSATPTLEPTFGPSPTPTPTGAYDNPFTCGFSNGGTKKPYNVSNFICSTEPSPAP